MKNKLRLESLSLFTCTALLTISVKIYYTTKNHTAYAKLSIKSPLALAWINLLFIIFVQMHNKILFKQRVQHEEWALKRTCFFHEKSLLLLQTKLKSLPDKDKQKGVRAFGLHFFEQVFSSFCSNCKAYQTRTIVNIIFCLL